MSGAGRPADDPSGIAYWGQRTLNDTQRYVDTVGPLVDEPQVQEVVATTVTDAIARQVDIKRLLDDVFAQVRAEAPRLELLAGPLAAAIEAAVEREVRAVLASDAFEELWVRINTRAQQVLHRFLEGGQGGVVELQGDDVVLDVSEIIDEVKNRLAARGLTFVENVTVPQSDRQIVLMKAPGWRRSARSMRSPIRSPAGCCRSSRCSTWRRSCWRGGGPGWPSPWASRSR